MKPGRVRHSEGKPQTSHRVLPVDSNDIVQLLTTRQHLHPHQTVSQVMQDATRELGCCPAAISRATQWLQIDSSRAVGRLRRSELLQFAHSVYRFWNETTVADTKPTRPEDASLGDCPAT